MLLRRIAAHIQSQNWTAVFLDFLIVVLGVFIGIQVSNWNARRADNSAESIILERLASDFEAIEAQTKPFVPRLEAALAASKDALELIASAPDSLDIGSYCTLLDPARRVVNAPAQIPTYVQLVANGEMRLIRDEALRTTLVQFEAQRALHEKIDEQILGIALDLGREFWRVVDLCDASALHPSRRYDDQITGLVQSSNFAAALNSMISVHRAGLNFQRRTIASLDEVLTILR